MAHRFGGGQPVRLLAGLTADQLDATSPLNVFTCAGFAMLWSQSD